MRRYSRALVIPTAIAAAILLAPALHGSAVTRPAAAAQAVHGGTLRVGYAGGFTTFDPAQALGDDWFVMNGTLYNGLYQADRHGVPRLDLAASPPTISADRTVWTFRLRKDVRFSNGMPLTAGDVKFSLTRVLDPHLKPAVSWAQSADAVFKGSQQFIAGKATSVAGIQVLDRHTIRFTLTHPVAVLPYLLASSYNMIVPKAVVTKEGAESFASHPIGTGPFVLQSWQKGVQAVFVRNPLYVHRSRPYLDRIIAYSNVTPSLLALKVEKGELDGMGNASEILPADVQQARKDARYTHYLTPAPTTLGMWMDLNVHAAPLTNPALRQAIALAINRTRLTKLLGGAAIPATQLYVPVYPQFAASLIHTPIYGHDLQRAAALVKASHYHGQAITLYYGSDYAAEASVALGIQQDLRQIGLDVTLRGTTLTSLNALNASMSGHPLELFLWGIDYTDAFDVYSAEFSCAANAPGGVSGPHYCNPAADALVDRGERLPLGPARDALFRQAQALILRSASRVPLVFMPGTVLVQPHVGGFYYQPSFGWQFENYWLSR